MAYCSQVLCGVPWSWYCNYFFTLSGLSTNEAFNLGVGNTAICFVGTALTFFMLSYVGRRHAYLGGLTFLTIVMFIIAARDAPSDYNSNRGFS
ncbi:hypothetical protein TOPH_08881 [Tolypocladium ophioglossoides CBS 100239]|uniref:Uncharacterized protein n=1 Tax=Tolypocladium ophioglossoides (strain CBS 100239) TaxID=1163406 RepID=A0A0L0MXG6_TOLOC|nr:hypothetical protein TOPH_08881 [Tolypocladium ophioglossoides CBS 100239]